MSIADTIQENVRFRLNSARAMVVGSNDVAQAEPLQRRREIIRRRREALGGIIGQGGNSGPTVDVSAGQATARSEQISDPNKDDRPTTAEKTRNQGTTSFDSSINPPSMSEVNRGTVERARDQGYGT